MDKIIYPWEWKYLILGPLVWYYSRDIVFWLAENL